MVFPKRLPMAGYSLGGPAGTKGHGTALHARALWLEDTTGNAVVFVAVELHSASRLIHEQAAIALAEAGIPVALDELVLFGTHTHTAPARFYGNALYETVTARMPTSVSDKVVDIIVSAVVRAVTAAFASRAPAEVGFADPVLSGIGRNRSIEAARLVDGDDDPTRKAAWADAGAPWKILGGPNEEARWVDPRVRLLVARRSGAGNPIGALALLACHNTLVPSKGKSYHSDWMGEAALRGAEALGCPVLIGASGAGDQTPLPVGKGEDDLNPAERANRIVTFGALVAHTIVSAAPAEWRPIEVEVRHHGWQPLETGPGWLGALPKIESWNLGMPALAGAEDHRSGLPFADAKEGRRRPDASDPTQSPKIPALWFLNGLAKAAVALRPSREHPLHLVRLSKTTIVTVPGEPTVAAAWLLEHAARGFDSHSRAWVIGYAGDYASYFTTPVEYEAQHYEGASTIYGRNAMPHLIALYARLADRARAPIPKEIADWSGGFAPILELPGAPTVVWSDEEVAVVWWASAAPTDLRFVQGGVEVDRAHHLQTLVTDKGSTLFSLTLTPEATDRAQGLQIRAYGALLANVPPAPETP